MVRSASFVFATLLLSPLSGCDNSNSGGTSSTPSAKPTAKATAAATATGAAGSKLSCAHPLVIWPALNGDEVQFAKDQGKAFEQQSGLTVKILEVPFDELQKKFIQAVPGGQGPDLLYGPGDWAGTLAEGGFIADLTGKFDASKYLDSTVKAATYKGKLVGVPESFEVVTQFYNTKIFAEAPKSFDDYKAGKTAAGQYGIAWEITEFYRSVAFLHAVGGTLFDDQGNFTLTEEAATKWLTELKKLKESGAMPKEATREAAKTLFIGGKSGAYFSGPWDVADVKKGQTEWKLAKLPKIAGGDAKPFLGSKLFYVSSKSTCAEAALAFVASFTSAPVELQWVQKTNPAHLPALKTAYDDAALKDNPATKAFREQAETSVPTPNIQAMGQVWTPGGDALNAVLNQNTAPEAAAKKMVATIKANIEKQNKQ
jgi:maltose-binding protein MalE